MQHPVRGGKRAGGGKGAAAGLPHQEEEEELQCKRRILVQRSGFRRAMFAAQRLHPECTTLAEFQHAAISTGATKQNKRTDKSSPGSVQ